MIETTDLVKRYGQTAAVDEVDLDVPDGSVYGLVGPNGAGKTTMLGLLAGLRRPTSGTIRIDADHEGIAVLPDTPRFDQWLTGREVVALAQRLATGGDDAERVDAMLHEAGIGHAADRNVGGYSRGMLQRLGIAATVVGSPRLLLLDEPASALDPQGRREVLDLVSRLRGSATVLFSSHILGDVQEVCDRVGILDQGRLIFQGTIEELLVGSAVPQYVVRCRPPVEPVLQALAGQDWVENVETTDGDELVVTVDSLEQAETLLTRALADAGARVVSMGPRAVTLEQAFLEVTR
jgi:ABC-2 type transport system ATP-binding protein